MDILYEDKNLIFLVKPAGVFCEDTKNGDSMISIIREHKLRKGEDENVFAVHRLDVTTSGVMVYAKNKASAGKLSAIVSDHEKFKKGYLTVIEGKPENDKGIYEDLLFKDSFKNKSYVVKRKRKGVKEASLYYELINTKEVEGFCYSLLRIRLFTGRTHQIRVQLSSRKTPILGDGKYGSRDSNCDIALYSHSISFENPFDKKELVFKSFPDFDIYPWNIFKEEAENL